jgi:hypothetical protein
LPCKPQEKQRADERTRTADLLQLRVINRVLQGFAQPCKPLISKGFSLLCLAQCCIPGGVRVVSAEQVVKSSTFYETAAVSKCFVIRADVFSACRLELLLVRLTVGCEFVGLADSSGIKDAFPST